MPHARSVWRDDASSNPHISVGSFEALLAQSPNNIASALPQGCPVCTWLCAGRWRNRTLAPNLSKGLERLERSRLDEEVVVLANSAQALKAQIPVLHLPQANHINL